MTQAETATVYNFHWARTWATKAMPETAPYKATRDQIAELGGKLLEGTAEEIPLRLIDPAGRYQRMATGWGILAED